MKKFICISLVSSLALTACATPSYNYVPKVELISKPAVGETNTASVGDQLLTYGNMTTQEGIRLSSMFDTGGFEFQSGFYPKTGEEEGKEYFSAPPGAVKKGLLQDPFQSIVYKKEENKLCAVTVYNLTDCKDAPSFQYDHIVVEGSNSFQQTLIYSGRVGDKINIGYREFSGNSARPAFNNEVEYDLGQDMQIAYKGAELKVISANNKEITYEVISNFRK